MAAQFPLFLPGQAEFFNELFADTDSENEFEGFSAADVNEECERNENLDIDPDAWSEGCIDKVPLEFTATPGLNIQLPESPSLLDIFNLFIKDSDCQLIVDQTNIYAHQYLSSHDGQLPPNSRFRKWTDTNVGEMKVFISLVLAMGLVSQTDMKEFWSTDPVTATPFFPSCMARDRFQIILSFLHLNDNTHYIPRGQEGHDPLYKLGAVYKNITQRFSKVYTSNKDLSFDEGMIPWRGNLSFRVYNPDKPVKYGIKAYMLCDATNGYVNKFRLYTGKMHIRESGAGATYDLVMEMMAGYFNQGYVLYSDNYYSSPRLFWDLWLLGVGASGTLRKTRIGVPQAIKDKKLNRKGETYVMSNGPMSVVKYLDGNYVFMLTTVDSVDPVATRNRDQEGNPVTRPRVVVQYDKYMGGVDRADQMISYHHILGSVKWWKKVFFHIISLTVLNSYIVYKEVTTNRPPLLHRIFRRNLIKEIVSSVGIPPSHAVGRPSAQVLDRLHGRHFPMKITSNANQRAYPKSCVVCSKAERQQLQPGQKRKHTGHTTSYCCKQCGVALCIVPCFELYHTKQEYVLAYKRLQQNSVVTTEE